MSEMHRSLCREKGGILAEPEPSLDPFSERHLQCVWFDDRLRPAPLNTERGEELRILNPGRWNREAGPDFLQGEWEVGGRRIQGDIEIHIRPMDWKHHGHTGDPSYGNVRLHVCYEPGELPRGVLPGDCEEVSLKSLLDQRSHFFFDTIDVHAYPWQKSGANRGVKRFLEDHSEEEKARFLEAAGQERLRRKTLRMIRIIEAVGPEQALYLSLVRGLGYKWNADAAEKLASALPLSHLQQLAGDRTLDTYALLLGVSGLLPADPEKKGLPPFAPLRKLWDLWWPHQLRFSAKKLSRQDWRTDLGRPANHPCLRLAAAAVWAANPKGLLEPFQPRKTQPDTDWIRECLDRLQAVEPWTGRRVVGRMRAGALFLNAVLPWRLATHAVQPTPELWSGLPEEELNSKARDAAAFLFGPNQHPRLFRGGLRKQGLLQFYEDFGL